MEQQFPVTINGKVVGKVLLQRQGLYYCFFCRCNLSGNIIYRLIVTCDTVRENLGILVPQGNAFILNTKVPVKRIGEGHMTFILVSKHDNSNGIFIPISPEEPFAYISRLKNSFLVLRDGTHGICIEKMQE